MSENILNLIPGRESFVPNQSRQKKARDTLESYLPQGSNVSANTTEQIEFIDSGANFEEIFCPICGRNIDTSWWQEAMDLAFQSQFTDLTIVTPCCQAVLSLNDLIYKPPSGFARFALVARNPQIDINEVQLEILSEILGCDLKKIWSRY